QQCDDDQDGFSLFNLNEVINEITANATNETVSFFRTEADANSTTNSIINTTVFDNEIVSSDVVWARVENGNGCFRTSLVNLTVTTTQIPSSFMRDFHACDNAGDGVSYFDFSSVDSEIGALFPMGQDLVINYYRNQADALAENEPIADISNYRNIDYPYMQQIYVRVDSKIDNDCIGLGAHINLYVESLPEFNIETSKIVCSSNPNFTVLLDPDEIDSSEVYNYQWVYESGEILSNAPTLTVATPGTYSITLTKTDATGCSKTKEVYVNASEVSTITPNDVTIVELSDNNSITINNINNNLGLGDYEFALDNISGAYQDDSYFDNLEAGEHTIYVQDKNGCGISELKVFILGFPKFFTPNNDGYHDTWNIEGLSHEYTPNSSIRIFDRYGKLLKQLRPREKGWDGVFNGKMMIQSDYWFVASLENINGNKTIHRGHFSLVR
ncbi:MAG: T9SS type B sorting domain-containing protein, partial [Flavobacteriaceae bacterium]